jgi:hypothetical protein
MLVSKAVWPERRDIAWILPSSSSSSREVSESSDSDGYLNVLRSLVVSIVAKVEGMWDTKIQKVLERTRYVKEMEVPTKLVRPQPRVQRDLH